MVKIGTDILAVKRMAKFLQKWNKEQLSKVFTKSEIDYCESKKNKNARVQSYCGRFCAKEAVAKAFGCGIGEKLAFSDIEIINNSKGAPFVGPNRKIQNLLTEQKLNGISLSISHDKKYTTATAVAFR